MKRKRGSEREAKERLRQEEILSKENKKLILKCSKDKRKSESIDRNKVRAVYRKDFSSELKRVRSDAVVTVLQCFDAEETVQEQAEHTRYFLNSSNDPDFDTDTEESDRKIKLAALFATLPSCDKAFLRSQDCLSQLKNREDSSHGQGSLDGKYITPTNTPNSSVHAHIGTAKSVIWDDVFQASTCLSVFSERLQLQVPLTLEGLVKRIAHISLAGEVSSFSARNDDPSSSSSLALNSHLTDDSIKSGKFFKTACENEDPVSPKSNAIHGRNGTSHTHSNLKSDSKTGEQTDEPVASTDTLFKNEVNDVHPAMSSIKIETKAELIMAQELTEIEIKEVEEVESEVKEESSLVESGDEINVKITKMDVVVQGISEAVMDGGGSEEGERDGISNGDLIASSLSMAVADSASVESTVVLEKDIKAEEVQDSEMIREEEADFEAEEVQDSQMIKDEEVGDKNSDPSMQAAEVINVDI